MAAGSFLGDLKGLTEGMKAASSQGVWNTLLPLAIIILLFGLLLVFFALFSRAGGESQKWNAAIAVTMLAFLILLGFVYNLMLGKRGDQKDVKADHADTVKPSSSPNPSKTSAFAPTTQRLIMRTKATSLVTLKNNTKPTTAPSPPTTAPNNTKPTTAPSPPTTVPNNTKPMTAPSPPTTTPNNTKPKTAPSPPTTTPNNTKPTTALSPPTTAPNSTNPTTTPSPSTTAPVNHTTTTPSTETPQKSMVPNGNPKPVIKPRGPRLEQTLLCTFGYKMDTSVVVPEDGLCDFTLYDSVFKNYTYNLETPYEDSLQHFLSFASQHVKTQYGVAFSFIPEEERNPIEIMLASNPSKVQTDIMDLWNQNISHFGYVDIGRIYVDEPTIERVLQVLKHVFEMLKGMHSVERPCYTMITLPMNLHDQWLESIAITLRKFGHIPDALIGLAHLAERDFYSGYACRIMPPLFLQVPQIPPKFQKESYYAYSMNTTHTNLKIFASRERPSSALFVTVPMFAKWYTYFYDEYTFETECGDTSLPSVYGTVTQACRSQDCNTTFVTTPHMGVLTACIQNHTVLTYENDESYRYKLCTLKKDMTRVRYGFLAMDIDTDDPANQCGRGGYARLRSLRRLLEFFKNNFTSPGDCDNCIKGL